MHLGATLMSLGDTSACSYAFFAAICVALSPVMQSPANAEQCVAGLRARDDLDGLFRVFLAPLSRGASTTAGSAVGDGRAVEDLERVGHHLGVQYRLIVISFWNCAYLFFAPCLWFFTATEAIISSVVPYSCMCLLRHQRIYGRERGA